jgi:beta-glucosidase-like glycosyl hydrolase
LVLLKNGRNQTEPFLPLAKNVKRILVAGKHADDIGYQCGGWTIAWHGDSGKITPGKNKLSFTVFVYYLCSLEVFMLSDWTLWCHCNSIIFMEELYL